VPLAAWPGNESAQKLQTRTLSTSLFSTYTPSLPSTLPSPPSTSPHATMGFTDFVSDTGLTLLNNWVKTRSYIVG